MKAPLRHPVGEREKDRVVRVGNEQESVGEPGVTSLEVNSVYTSSLRRSVSLTRARSPLCVRERLGILPCMLWNSAFV